MRITLQYAHWPSMLMALFAFVIMCGLRQFAESGESALTMIDREAPNVMVSDLKMPGVDGFTVLKTVKETRPNAEVIFLTARESRQEKEECMRLGAFDYLQKPLDIAVLSDTLRKAKEKISRVPPEPPLPDNAYNR